MKLSALSIEKPVPFILLFIFLTLGGFWGFKNLPVQDFPDVDFPTVTVTASMSGYGVVQMETDVTKKVEDAVASLEGVDHISSTVSEGVSTTSVTFVLEKSLSDAQSDVRDAISRIKQDLPDGMSDPSVTRNTTAGGAIVTYTVISRDQNEVEEERASRLVDDEISRRLTGIKGVGKIERVGGVDREIKITANRQRMMDLGISPVTLASSVTKEIADGSSGSYTTKEGELAARTKGKLTSVESLSDVTLKLTDGAVKVSDVADVRDSIAKRSQLSLLNGTPTVSFRVYRNRGFGEIEVVKKVREEVEKIQKENSSFSIKEVSSTIPKVESNYSSAMKALLEGGILAVVVVFFFLRDWRATIISAVALPLSILPTFWAMHMWGFTLNTLTLLSLTLVVGILVDDAIVEVENVARHMNNEPNPVNATKKAVEEIGVAVIATSFTLMAVFLPTAFMSGVVGRFFKQFGLTAAVAVGMSLLVARFLTPMMAALFMKPTKHALEPSNSMKAYMSLVDKALNAPRITTFASILFLAVSALMFANLSATFLPREEKGQVTINIEAEPGVTYAEMKAKMQEASFEIKDTKGVTSIHAMAGAKQSSGPGGSSSASLRKGTIVAELNGSEKQAAVEAAFSKKLDKIAGVRISFGAGASGEKVSIKLASTDPEKLSITAKNLETQIKNLSWASNVTSSASLTTKEINVMPDRSKMAQYGVSVSSLSESLRIAADGQYDVNRGKVAYQTRDVSVKIEMPVSENIEDSIMETRVDGASGLIPIANVASFSMLDAPASIERYDRKRTVTIEAPLKGMPLSEALRDINGLSEMKNLPSGVSYVPSGDAERMAELFGNFGWAMLAGLVAIYVVLVLLFHDFAQPGTILAALPLSAGGALGGLALFGQGLSMPALIGLLMLMGIVTKNSILLVEYAVKAKEKGMDSRDAIMEACSKRVRPIVMTSVAMIAGMLPMAAGASSSFNQPMAIAVIGGLLTSTVLSLIVVPVIYVQVDNAVKFIKRKVI